MPLDQYEAKGILVGALAVLAARYGYSVHGNGPWRITF
jgi:hypothetical protein